MMEEEVEQLKQKAKKRFRYFLVALVLIAPLLIVVFVLSPLLIRKSTEDILKQYRLPPRLELEQAKEIVSKMRRDVSFGFYSISLPKDDWDAAIEEVSRILVDNQSRELLIEKINQEKQLVSSLGTTFLYTNIPQDFPQRPQAYPHLTPLIYKFIQEEFKLTILAICLKSTYDPKFILEWDDNLQRAAEKLKTIIFELKNSEI